MASDAPRDRTWAPEVVERVAAVWIAEEPKWFVRPNGSGIWEIYRGEETEPSTHVLIETLEGKYFPAARRKERLCDAACATAALSASPLPAALDLLDIIIECATTGDGNLGIRGHKAVADAAAFVARVGEG